MLSSRIIVAFAAFWEGTTNCFFARYGIVQYGISSRVSGAFDLLYTYLYIFMNSVCVSYMRRIFMPSEVVIATFHIACRMAALVPACCMHSSVATHSIRRSSLFWRTCNARQYCLTQPPPVGIVSTSVAGEEGDTNYQAMAAVAGKS